MTELANGYIASYQITDDGKTAGSKITSLSGQNDEANMDLSIADGTGTTPTEGASSGESSSEESQDQSSYEVVDDGEDVTVTYTNTKIPDEELGSIRLTKYNENQKGDDGEPVTGASPLFGQDQDGKNLGAVYEIRRTDDDRLVYTADFRTATLDRPSLEINGIVPGEYYLIETLAPDGFMLDSDKIYFAVRTQADGETVPPDGVIFVGEANQGNINLFDKELKEYILPSTGGVGIIVYTITGMLLILLGLIGLRLRKIYE